MKRVLTVDETMRIFSLLGILDWKTDFRDFGLEQCQVLSLPDLLNLFPCEKSSPIFELTRGVYNFNGRKYSKEWHASLEYNEVDKYYCHIAKEPIDAVYKLLCEYLEDKNNKKKAK